MKLGRGLDPGSLPAHKFTRASDFRNLAAHLRNFVAILAAPLKLTPKPRPAGRCEGPWRSAGALRRRRLSRN